MEELIEKNYLVANALEVCTKCVLYLFVFLFIVYVC